MEGRAHVAEPSGCGRPAIAGCRVGARRRESGYRTRTNPCEEDTDIGTWSDRLLDIAVVGTKIATLGFGIDAWRHHESPRLRGKAIRTRALGYSAALFLVPTVWGLVPDRGRYPRALDLAVTAPLLADAAGNALGVYDQAHVDDIVHGANAAVLSAVVGTLVRPHVRHAWHAAVVGGLVSIAGESLWEVMEYSAAALGQDGMHLSYEDTIGDLAATLIGATVGAAWVQLQAGPRPDRDG
jgi:hypothetical protein